MSVTRDDYAQALIAEFVTAVEAVLGTASAAATSEPGSADGWLLSGTVVGDLRGTIAAWIDRAGSETLAQRVMGMDETPDAATVTDMLKEMWSQAAGALSLKEPFTGIKLSVVSVSPGESCAVASAPA